MTDAGLPRSFHKLLLRFTCLHLIRELDDSGNWGYRRRKDSLIDEGPSTGETVLREHRVSEFNEYQLLRSRVLCLQFLRLRTARLRTARLRTARLPIARLGVLRLGVLHVESATLHVLEWKTSRVWFGWLHDRSREGTESLWRQSREGDDQGREGAEVEDEGQLLCSIDNPCGSVVPIEEAVVLQDGRQAKQPGPIRAGKQFKSI